MLSTTKSRLITSGKKLLLILVSCFLVLNSSFAQPSIQWQKCLGGTGEDEAYSVQQTVDGGYIVAGYAGSNSGDVTGNHGYWDYWVVKLDSSGILQWQKCLGGDTTDKANSIIQTNDGGYIVAGRAYSNNGDVTGNHGNYDYWVVKLNGSGTLQWQECLGGASYDDAYAIEQTSDGGCILAGWTASIDGNVTGDHGGGGDYWVVKLDTYGTLQWQKCLGGTGFEVAYSIQQTSDGGYIVAGFSASNDGDVTGNHGNSDYWIVKLNASGTLQWQKSLGGTDGEVANSVQQTSDGGYIAAGYTYSINGDVVGNHGWNDCWLVKLDSSGTLQWQKCLGGTNPDEAFSIEQTSDGGYIVAGQTSSNDGDVTGFHGADDYWVVKLNSSGTLQWQKCLGGNSGDYAKSIHQTTDGGYIVAGYASSFNGDVTGNHGSFDYWVVKLYPDFPTSENNSIINFESPPQILPNPFTSNAVISFSGPVYNATFSLYNLLGEKVAEATSINGGSFELNRGNLPSGVYIFEVREKDKSIARGKAVVY